MDESVPQPPPKVLQRHMRVHPMPERLGILSEAHAASRESAQQRIAHLRADRSQLGWPIPARAEVIAEFDRAAALGSEHLRLLVRDEGSGSLSEQVLSTRTTLSGGDDVPVPNPAPLHSSAVLASVLVHAERTSVELADLVDDLMMASAATVDMAYTRGSIPPDAAFGAVPATIIVLPHDDIVVSFEGSDSVQVGPGTSASGLGPVEIVGTDTPLPVTCLLRLRPLTQHDIVTRAAEMARYWPRLRGDLPYDPWLPADLYGYAEPVEAAPIVLEAVRQLFDSEPTENATAWWHATLCPASRPAARPTLSLVDLTVSRARGRFVGLPGLLSDDDEGIWLVAASAAFAVERPCEPLLAALLRNDWVELDNLDWPADRRRGLALVNQLVALGLVEIRRSDSHKS